MVLWKLYIWEGVYSDYTAMAVAMARDIEEAIGVLTEKGAYKDDLKRNKPKIIELPYLRFDDDPVAYWVCGG